MQKFFKNIIQSPVLAGKNQKFASLFWSAVKAELQTRAKRTRDAFSLLKKLKLRGAPREKSQHPLLKGKLRAHNTPYFLYQTYTRLRRRLSLVARAGKRVGEQQRADVVARKHGGLLRGSGENELRAREIRPRGQSKVGKAERNVVVSKEWEW